MAEVYDGSMLFLLFYIKVWHCNWKHKNRQYYSAAYFNWACLQLLTEAEDPSAAVIFAPLNIRLITFFNDHPSSENLKRKKKLFHRISSRLKLLSFLFFQIQRKKQRNETQCWSGEVKAAGARCLRQAAITPRPELGATVQPPSLQMAPCPSALYCCCDICQNNQVAFVCALCILRLQLLQTVWPLKITDLFISWGIVLWHTWMIRNQPDNTI